MRDSISVIPGIVIAVNLTESKLEILGNLLKKVYVIWVNFEFYVKTQTFNRLTRKFMLQSIKLYNNSINQMLN